MNQIIFHIDVNSAFLSWTAVEQLKEGAQVDLRTVPSIIGGDQESRHGVVLAKSIPAKKYGIKTGEPVAMALRKCPHLFMAKPDFSLYEHNSREFIRICSEYTPIVEKFSIPFEVAENLKRKVNLSCVVTSSEFDVLDGENGYFYPINEVKNVVIKSLDMLCENIASSLEKSGFICIPSRVLGETS